MTDAGVPLESMILLTDLMQKLYYGNLSKSKPTELNLSTPNSTKDPTYNWGHNDVSYDSLEIIV